MVVSGPVEGVGLGRRKTLAQTQSGAEGLQSLPALLERNAREFGDKPAFREKEYGIWQAWTWAQTAEEVEAVIILRRRDVQPRAAGWRQP